MEGLKKPEEVLHDLGLPSLRDLFKAEHEERKALLAGLEKDGGAAEVVKAALPFPKPQTMQMPKPPALFDFSLLDVG